MNLLNAIPITAAISTPLVTNSFQLPAVPRNLTAQANFVYGSGGTSVDAYLQTSLDAGKTWADIANFHFTTSSARPLINLSSVTPKTTQVTPTDGSLTANTAVDGILGALFRVKYQSSGTYAGATTLSLDVSTDQAA